VKGEKEKEQDARRKEKREGEGGLGGQKSVSTEE